MARAVCYRAYKGRGRAWADRTLLRRRVFHLAEPVETLDGWFMWHHLTTVDWAEWWSWAPADREAALAEWRQMWDEWAAAEAQHQGSVGVYAMAGARADFMSIHLRPTLDELIDIKASMQAARLHRVERPAYSYISVVELATYAAKGNPDPQTNPALRARLWPTLPDRHAVCFYPMSKRRQGADNWYMTDRADRAHLMRGHGAVGHKYSPHVTQIVSGSQGLDDWEWGVTLVADDPIWFKKLVYEMRFDEASARFAEFGPFYVGTRVDAAGFARRLGVR